MRSRNVSRYDSILIIIGRLFKPFAMLHSTGWPKKSKPLSIFQKIVLKIANEIRFLRKVKV